MKPTLKSCNSGTMKQSNATPIPWECEEGYYTPPSRQDRWHIHTAYEVESSFGSYKRDVAHMATESDAKLIVAAVNILPDLIEVLEQALLNEGQDGCRLPLLDSCNCWRCKARTALDKVKGVL